MIVVLFCVIIYIQIVGKPLNPFTFELVIIFTVVTLIATEIHRLGNAYEIHEHSIVHKKGYLRIRSKRIEFSALSDLDVEQTLWQRIFSFGDIQLYKFSDGPVLKNLNNPHHFVDLIEKEVIKRRRTIR